MEKTIFNHKNKKQDEKLDNSNIMTDETKSIKINKSKKTNNSIKKKNLFQTKKLSVIMKKY